MIEKSLDEKQIKTGMHDLRFTAGYLLSRGVGLIKEQADSMRGWVQGRTDMLQASQTPVDPSIIIQPAAQLKSVAMTDQTTSRPWL